MAFPNNNNNTPPIVTTAGSAQSSFADYSSQLQKALTMLGMNTSQMSGMMNSGSNTNTANNTGDVNAASYSDPYTQLLAQHANTADAASRALISSIQAKRDQNAASIDKNYDNYKRGLQLLGIQHNQAQFTPDLLAGHITAVENEHQQKIQSLDAEEAKALMDAQNARETNNLKVLKEKMDYVKDLRKQKQDVLKETYDKMNLESKISANQAHTLYSTLQTLNPAEKEIFLQKVATTYNIPLNTLVSAVADEHVKQMKGVKKGTGAKGTGSSKFNISSAVAAITPQIVAMKGEDGYIDPYKWVAGREKWMSNGGSAASYNSNFKQYLNPESYGIAGFKAPAKK